MIKICVQTLQASVIRQRWHQALTDKPSTAIGTAIGAQTAKLRWRSWMQWVTGWPEKTEKRGRCALQATLTLHVRTALCTSVSVDSAKLFHAVKWRVNWFLMWPHLRHYFEFYRIGTILWHCFLSIFMLLWFLLCTFIWQVQFYCYILGYCLFELLIWTDF